MSSVEMGTLGTLRGARRRFDELAVRSVADIMTRAFSGSRGWRLLDRMGVPGFGTNLMRSFFPLADPTTAAWTASDPAYARIAAVLESHRVEYEPLIHAIAPSIDVAADWPRKPDAGRPNHPCLDNEFFPLFDTVVLYGLLRHLRPQRFVEVGSGTSTRIAHCAKADGGFPAEIISVDPQPRAEIDALCTRTIRRPFDRVSTELVNEIRPGDVLFIDGSHHCFPNSDVTHLFMNVLPQLSRGVVVHLHDIYLPDDYPAEHRGHLWSEQYLLGAWLLGGGAGFRPLFPAAYLSRDPTMRGLVDRIDQRIPGGPLPRAAWHRQGTSFWMIRE